MVALHELIIELFAANGALMVLLFPYGKLNLVGKNTKVEVMLITCQNIRDDALLFLYFIISYQVDDLLFHRLDIEYLLMIFVIEFRPIQALHYFLKFLHVEGIHSPTQYALEISP